LLKYSQNTVGDYFYLPDPVEHACDTEKQQTVKTV